METIKTHRTQHLSSPLAPFPPFPPQQGYQAPSPVASYRPVEYEHQSQPSRTYETEGPNSNMPNAQIAKRLAYGPHCMLLFFLSFITFILLVLVTFSSPFITSIYFLRNNAVHFGAYGWSSPGFKSDDVLGYEYGQQVLKPLTSSQILWGIASVFALFTLIAIIPLLWVHENAALHAVANNSFFTFCSWLTFIITTIIWCMSILGWSNAHRAFTLASSANHPAMGAAIWMGLAAAMLSALIIILGWPTDALGGSAGPNGNGYYHYKHSTREVTRPRVAQPVYV